MANESEKRHWDDYWAASRELGEVYANDDRIVGQLRRWVDPAGLRVLEVGAGTGRDSAALAAAGAEVWTLDYSEEALRLMRDGLREPVTIVCGDALRLPIADGAFDVVFHQGLLEHFRDPAALLAENHRVLRGGGVLLVDVPQRFHYYTLAKHVLIAIDRWFAGWETEFSPGELAGLVRRAGFEVLGLYGHNLDPPIWYRGIRRALAGRGVRLPMEPPGSRALAGLRRRLRRALPRTVVLHTSMVVGCVARKEADA